MRFTSFAGWSLAGKTLVLPSHEMCQSPRTPRVVSSSSHSTMSILVPSVALAWPASYSYRASAFVLDILGDSTSSLTGDLVVAAGEAIVVECGRHWRVTGESGVYKCSGGGLRVQLRVNNGQGNLPGTRPVLVCLQIQPNGGRIGNFRPRPSCNFKTLPQMCLANRYLVRLCSSQRLATCFAVFAGFLG
jgi:hypothetical protein